MNVQLWTKDLDAAARRSAALYPQEMKKCIALADQICGNAFMFSGHWEMERTHAPVSFGAGINWEHIENGDAEWMYALNRHSFLVTLGRAWRYTRDPRYPAAAMRLWEDWIDRIPLTKQSKHTTWRSIEAGLRCENWLRALALFDGSGAPDGIVRTKIERSLRKHATYLLEAHGSFQKISNWGVLQDHGLFLLGLAFDEPQWREIAAERLVEALHHQLMGDGTHWEQSPLYHCEVLHCCLNVLLCASRIDYPLPGPFYDTTKQMARALAAMLRPDGKLICQGDTDEIDARDLLALAAYLFHDSALKGAAITLQNENIWDFHDREDVFDRIPSVLSRNTDSTALPDSGNYMLRDGADPAASYLHFHCGALGSGHGHADLLHVDLVCRGENILCDSGRYTYADTPLRHSLKSAEAHNVVLIDGHSFSVPKDTWVYSKIAEPIKGQHRFTPDIDYVEGAHLGYLDLGVLHRRRVLRLGKDLWVLWDGFYATEGTKHLYQHQYHFGPQGDVSIEGNMVVFQGKRCAARVAFAGQQPSLHMSRYPVSREYNLLEEGDCLSASFKAKGFASLATIIATGDTDPGLSVQETPVLLTSRGTALTPGKAQGLMIRTGRAEYGVIVCHNEVIGEVDMLQLGEYSGYGKVLVFTLDNKRGVRLAW